MIKVLFVCLGNICRSPMAEGIFKKLVKEDKLDKVIDCDSAGTSSYHVGEQADSRMSATALSFGIELTHKARQLIREDIEDFDYIIPMDGFNMRNIMELKENCYKPKAKVIKMRYFDPPDMNDDVPDPYYGGPEGFEKVYGILERSGKNLLEYIKREHNL